VNHARRLVITVMVFATLAVGGCSAASYGPVPQWPERSASASAPQAPRPTPDEPVGGPSKSPQIIVDDFMRNCEKATKFISAQVDFPRTMTLRVGASDSYSTAVDIRANPAPPGQVIDTPDPRSEPIKVQCVLSARLRSVGDGMDVVASSDTYEGGWRTLKFTPDGVVEWSWTVKALVPANQRLRLQLQPAVKIEGSSQSGINATSADYITNVDVQASLIESASYWIKIQYPLLTGILGVLAAAFLAVSAFSSKARDALAKLFKRKPATETSSQPEVSLEDATKQESNSRKKKGVGKKS
jgi:hypothetical protein